MMMRTLALAGVLCVLSSAGWAQGYIRIPTCGTASPPMGGGQGYMDANGNICGTGTGGTFPTVPSARTSAGAGQFGVTVASATLMPSIPAAATVAQITVEGQSVRCTDDGTTTPTSSVGTLYAVGTIFNEFQPALAALKCIQTTATATLDVAYYKP